MHMYVHVCTCTYIEYLYHLHVYVVVRSSEFAGLDYTAVKACLPVQQYCILSFRTDHVHVHV